MNREPSWRMLNERYDIRFLRVEMSVYLSNQKYRVKLQLPSFSQQLNIFLS